MEEFSGFGEVAGDGAGGGDGAGFEEGEAGADGAVLFEVACGAGFEVFGFECFVLGVAGLLAPDVGE